MSDKLKKGVSAMPSFVDGENPTASKFNSIPVQTERSLTLVEKAVGDILDESYPYSSLNDARLSNAWGRHKNTGSFLGETSRILGIANLARLIGPSANLNPNMPMSVVSVTEDLPSGVYSYRTKFKLDSFTSSTDPAIVTFVLDPANLNATGEFHRDGSEFFTYDALSGGTITYEIDPSNWGSGPTYTGSTFNVIPDPVQIAEGGNGCTVSISVDGESRHTITLPLCTHLAHNHKYTSSTLDDEDPYFEEQITLPEVLTNNYALEEVIPSGFLYLKNWTTGQVYKDATYYYVSPSELLIGGVDLAEAAGMGDQFLLITVGTDICTALDDTRHKVFSHSHNGAYGEAPIEASSIVGWTKEDPSSGPYTKSNIPGNYAPQYLHRDGHRATDGGMNDRNIMRGDLVIGADTRDSGTYYNDVNGSFGIYFGTKNGPSIAKANANKLKISNPLTNGIEIESDGIILDGAIEEQPGDPTSLPTTHSVSNINHIAGNNVGHSMRMAGSNISDAIAVGPFSTEYTNPLSLFSREEDAFNGPSGETFATTDNTGAPDMDWVVPRIQFIHYSQKNVNFVPYSYNGGTTPDWNDVAYWQQEFDLPAVLSEGTGLGGSMIIGAFCYVRGGSEQHRWHTVGFDNRRGSSDPSVAEVSLRTGYGVRISYQIDGAGAPNANAFQIRIAADGSEDYNTYHWKPRMDAAGETGTDTANNIELDVKITLIVLAPSKVFSF